MTSLAFGQEEEKQKEPDTTRMNFGNTEILIIEKGNKKDESEENEFESEFELDETEHYKTKNKSEAHWAGIDLGFTMLMNSNLESKFEDHAYWQNDAAKSISWNFNLFEHKFRFGTDYVGLTTGLGFNFTSVAISDNYVLMSSPDSVYAEIDSVYTYTKNKLKASYLTVPLLLEFNTSSNNDKSFYLAAGVVGGVRIGSKTKLIGELDGKEFKEKRKGTYNLNPFKLDALVRLGYSDWGVFASYDVLPLFEEGKTDNIYPLTFGLSLNF